MAEELKALLIEARGEWALDDEDKILLSEFASAIQKFGNARKRELARKIASLSASKRSVFQPKALSSDSRELLGEFQNALGQGTTAVVERIGKMSKDQVVSLASALGMSVNSRTTKTNAMTYIRQRDARQQRRDAGGDAIRKGA